MAKLQLAAQRRFDLSPVFQRRVAFQAVPSRRVATFDLWSHAPFQWITSTVAAATTLSRYVPALKRRAKIMRPLGEIIVRLLHFRARE